LGFSEIDVMNGIIVETVSNYSFENQPKPDIIIIPGQKRQ